MLTSTLQFGTHDYAADFDIASPGAKRNGIVKLKHVVPLMQRTINVNCCTRNKGKYGGSLPKGLRSCRWKISTCFRPL